MDEDKQTIEVTIKQGLKSNESNTRRFFPIFFDIGLLQTFTRYPINIRNMMKSELLSLNNYKQKISVYLQSILNITNMKKHIEPSIIGIMNRGVSFGMFDYLCGVNHNKIKSIWQYYFNGCIAGILGFIGFKSFEYIFRRIHTIKIQKYVYLQFFYPQILKQNIKHILRDPQFFKYLKQETPLVLLWSSLYFGLFFSIRSEFNMTENSLLNYCVALMTTTLTQVTCLPISSYKFYRAFSKQKTIFGLIKLSIIKRFSPISVMQQSLLLYVFSDFLKCKKNDQVAQNIA